MNPVIYTTFSGWQQTEFSNSQFQDYTYSPAAYRWRRLLGWQMRKRWAVAEFGKSVEEALRSFLIEKADPISSFAASWRAQQTNHLTYPEHKNWQSFFKAGTALMKEFLKQCDRFPLQNVVFPNWEERFRFRDTRTGFIYTALTDMIGEDAGGRFICDIKAVHNFLRLETPGLIVQDQQLRTQAAAAGCYRVVLWTFGRSPVKNLAVFPAGRLFEEAKKLMPTFATLAALYLAARLLGLSFAKAGDFLGLPEVNRARLELRLLLRNEPGLKAALETSIAELGKELEKHYEIRWLAGQMHPSHAEEAVRDQLSVIPAIQAHWFPCRCGIRWPNDRALHCPYRGLCLKERSPVATAEEHAAWQQITNDELLHWEGEALKYLDADEKREKAENEQSKVCE
jgi:hypothetical protein